MYEATDQALWDNKVGREGMELGKSLFLLEIKNVFSWVISTELYPKVLQKNEQWSSIRADIIFAIFIVYHQYLALRLELKQHLKKKKKNRKIKREGREKEKEGKEKGRKKGRVEGKGAKAIKCASQISCYQEHNQQLIDAAAEFWVDTKTMHPITAFSQRVSMVRELRPQFLWNVGSLWCGLWLKNSPLTWLKLF